MTSTCRPRSRRPIITAAPAPIEDAESGTRGRTGEPTPGSDLDRLRDILLGDEREGIEIAQARIARVERAQSDLAQRLPEAIERANEGTGATRMADALARPVTAALGSAVRENRQVIVDVLFPIIGPAIRKAIAEALRALVADVNGAIESSFTRKGLRWRVESMRSGVPYAQIVLKHTLNYRIDHVFLIERDSGLVLARESAPDLPDLDADAIAGMLTAIGEFVRDSVGQDGGTLESARVGEHLLWVLQGPRANLACFIHGVPPANLHARLEQVLEDIHSRFDSGGALDESARAWLKPAALDQAVQSDAVLRKPSRWPMLAVLILALGAIAWWAVRAERWRSAIDDLRTRLSAHPGFVLTGIEEDGQKLTVHGLLDADSEPPDVALKRPGYDTVQPVLDTVGYVSTDDPIVARRARRMLDAPPGVAIATNQGVLSLSGRAPQAWIDAAHERAGWIAGVRRVDFALEAETDSAAVARAELADIARSLPAKRVRFVREIEIEPGSEGRLEEIVQIAQRANTLARNAGVAVAWTAVGANDDPGGNEVNARVRADRARWLADALGARGIANVAVDAAESSDATLPRERAAYLRLVVGANAR